MFREYPPARAQAVAGGQSAFSAPDGAGLAPRRAAPQARPRVRA